MRAVILVVSLIILTVSIVSKAVSGETSKRVQILHGSPYVQLQHGLYFGKTLSNLYKHTYHQFIGIRYASTPNRYEKSVPMTEMDMISVPVLANSYGSQCPQLVQNGSTFIGKEDCLLANVYIPNRDPVDNDGFPVIVLVHPGAFKTGNGGAFDVSYFMSENVICATFNYRLGALGFLNADGISNLGLYDQITFLEWVNSNIGAFGGNKKRVTVAGIESGAASVKYLLLSQSTKGLFQSAIIHGGLMFSTFVSHLPSHMREFTDELECPHRPIHILVECLKTKRLKDIMRSQKIVSEKYFAFSSPFLPTFETCDRFKSCLNPYFAKPPALLLAERQFKRVPLLVGINSVSTSLLSSHFVQNPALSPFQPELELETDNDTLTRWLTGVLENIPGFQHECFSSSFFLDVQQLYFKEFMGNNSVGHSSNRPRSLEKSLGHFLYDIFVLYGLWKFAITYAHTKPVYNYIITFPENGNNSLSDHYNRAFPDGVEFLTPSLPKYHEFKAGSDEEIFSQQLVHLWATFATHQKPVDIWRNKETWMPLSAAQLNGEKPLTWYTLNKEVDIIPDPFSKRMKFWDKAFKQKCR